MNKEIVNVRLDPEIISALWQIAEKSNVTVSDLLRWGVLKIIEEFRNSEVGQTWNVQPLQERKLRELSEEQKHKLRVRTSAQTYARTMLQQTYKSDYDKLFKEYGRNVARSLLVRMYYAEYQDLYQAALAQQP